MTGLEVYGNSGSAETQSLCMVLELLHLEYKFKNVNVADEEHKVYEFIALNPEMTLPVLVDGSLVVTNSRAAITYLVSTYGDLHSNDLYPEEPSLRALVDQRLYFNAGTFSKRFQECVVPVYLKITTNIDKETKKSLIEAIQWFDEMLVNGFVAGDSITVADVDFLPIVSALEACKLIELKQWKNLSQWLLIMKKEIPNYQQTCGTDAEIFGKEFLSNYNKKSKIKVKLLKKFNKGIFICSED